MVREENSYLKAEILGLQKQVESPEREDEGRREGLQKKLEEERDRDAEEVSGRTSEPCMKRSR